MSCAFHCHEVGGPFIAENPECPIHGADGFDISDARDLIERMCARLERIGFAIDLTIVAEARSFLESN